MQTEMEETEIKLEVVEEEPLALVKRVVEVEDEEDVEVSTTTPMEDIVTSSGKGEQDFVNIWQ